MNTQKQPHTNALSPLGWTPYFQQQMDALAAPGLFPARVIGVSKNRFRTSNGRQQGLATAAGKLCHDTGALYPVTGDWVLMKEAVITRVLERKNTLSRGASGARSRQDAQPRKAQVIAANIDTVFIVSGLDRDFNPRRIERYLTLIYNCGLNPVIVLTKADLHPDPGRFVGDVEPLAFGVPIHLVSAREDNSLAALTPYLAPGQTTTMVGSSGAGKSTLVNRFCGSQVQETCAISAQVGKGRHTTTTRDLIVLPQGGMVIDNPGIREIGFWETENGMASAFPEIETLGKGCRFVDCSHTHEPGCQVLRAVEQGDLSRDRLENYRKMKQELTYLAQRQDKSADRVEKERWKGVALKIKALKKKTHR
jgi:ribosome biogenesis GTPase